MHGRPRTKGPDRMSPTKRLWLMRLAAYATALAVLLAVFAAYTRPDFLVTLADQLWSCF